jgi:hypothetical protein
MNPMISDRFDLHERTHREEILEIERLAHTRGGVRVPILFAWQM